MRIASKQEEKKKSDAFAAVLVNALICRLKKRLFTSMIIRYNLTQFIRKEIDIFLQVFARFKYTEKRVISKKSVEERF